MKQLQSLRAKYMHQLSESEARARTLRERLAAIDSFEQESENISRREKRQHPKPQKEKR